MGHTTHTLVYEESFSSSNHYMQCYALHGSLWAAKRASEYFASSRAPWIVRWPGVVEEGTINDINLISEVDFYPTILGAAEIKNYVFTQIDNKHSGQKMPKRSDACPMRGIQDRDFIYIFNAWSFSDAIYYNNNEGITMQCSKLLKML